MNPFMKGPCHQVVIMYGSAVNGFGARVVIRIARDTGQDQEAEEFGYPEAGNHAAAVITGRKVTGGDK